jgi:hypothetical protein
MMDTDLIAIGYWQSDKEPEFPHPRQLVGARLPEALRENLCAYLASGKEFMAWLGHSHCRFRCGIADSAMGCRDLTDGVWVWPEGLTHYVRAHDIALPDDFLLHARGCSWQVGRVIVPPVRESADGSSRLPVTHEFWKSFRGPALRPR